MRKRQRERERGREKRMAGEKEGSRERGREGKREQCRFLGTQVEIRGQLVMVFSFHHVDSMESTEVIRVRRKNHYPLRNLSSTELHF